MKKKIILILILVFQLSLNSCKKNNKTQENTNKIDNNLVNKNDTYLKTIEELNQYFFKNYEEIEKLVLNQLKKEGSEYFIKNNCYDILGRFESTL